MVYQRGLCFPLGSRSNTPVFLSEWQKAIKELPPQPEETVDVPSYVDRFKVAWFGNCSPLIDVASDPFGLPLH
jgi:hypothetical protein